MCSFAARAQVFTPGNRDTQTNVDIISMFTFE